MKQTAEDTTDHNDEKSKTEINLAKIGLISAIAVAVIGLLSTAVSAYFTSQTAQAPIIIPIQATQTAEAKSINSLVPISPTGTTNIPASTTESSMTATLPDQNPTVMPTNMPTVLPTESNQDWTSIFQIYTLGTCAQPVVLPSSIDFEEDPETVALQINAAASSNEVEKWQIGPGGRRIITLARNIVSKIENKEWIQLSNTARVIIRGKDTAPNHVNVLMTCAGGGSNRLFPPIELYPQFNQYEVSTTYQEADYFSLQPGEFESLHFVFYCTKPGIYSVELLIDYLYLDQTGKVTIYPPDLVCPDSYSLWESWQIPYKLGDYVWDGNEYIESP